MPVLCSTPTLKLICSCEAQEKLIDKQGKWGKNSFAIRLLSWPWKTCIQLPICSRLPGRLSYSFHVPPSLPEPLRLALAWKNVYWCKKGGILIPFN